MLKLLIIDDTKSVHNFVKGILNPLKSIAPTDVQDGSEAVNLLKAGRCFDIILLDWEMPILNGPKTLEEIKKLNVSTPVIMMTTKNKPEEIAQMLEAGAVEYLMKPFTSDILIEKLETVSGRTLRNAA